MNTHTEAPWRIRCETDSKGVKRYWIYGPIKNAPAHARAFNEPDARLIVTAPDLLRDLQSVLQRFDAELGILTDGRYSIKDFSECLEALNTIGKATEGAQ